MSCFFHLWQKSIPQGQTDLETYDLGASGNHSWRADIRPGHFQGVCQVMSRLLKLVEPDHLFMGQKDYQQCLVVQRLIEIMNLPVQFHTCANRTGSGWTGQSSRNLRLTAGTTEKCARHFPGP